MELDKIILTMIFGVVIFGIIIFREEYKNRKNGK